MQKLIEWKDIKGYEGYYQVSNTGLVKSVRRYIDVHPMGRKPYTRIKNAFILKPMGEGCLFVALVKNNVYETRSIANLVGEHFKNNGTYNKHKDGDLSNNCASNLI